MGAHHHPRVFPGATGPGSHLGRDLTEAVRHILPHVLLSAVWNDKGSVGPSPLCPRGTRASAGVVSRSPPLQGDSNPELSKCTCWDLSLMAYPLPG